MAWLTITEFAEMEIGWGGRQGQIAAQPPLAEQSIANAGGNTQSNAFNAKTRFVRLHTDSTYLLNGITKWIEAWQRNGWRTSAKKPVKNEDLWRRLIAAMNGHEVSWLWVKGHAGEEGNERADALARLGIEEAAGVA